MQPLSFHPQLASSSITTRKTSPNTFTKGESVPSLLEVWCSVDQLWLRNLVPSPPTKFPFSQLPGDVLLAFKATIDLIFHDHTRNGHLAACLEPYQWIHWEIGNRPPFHNSNSTFSWITRCIYFDFWKDAYISSWVTGFLLFFIHHFCYSTFYCLSLHTLQQDLTHCKYFYCI